MTTASEPASLELGASLIYSKSGYPDRPAIVTVNTDAPRTYGITVFTEGGTRYVPNYNPNAPVADPPAVLEQLTSSELQALLKLAAAQTATVPAQPEPVPTLPAGVPQLTPDQYAALQAQWEAQQQTGDTPDAGTAETPTA